MAFQTAKEPKSVENIIGCFLLFASFAQVWCEFGLTREFGDLKKHYNSISFLIFKPIAATPKKIVKPHK